MSTAPAQAFLGQRIVSVWLGAARPRSATSGTLETGQEKQDHGNLTRPARFDLETFLQSVALVERDSCAIQAQTYPNREHIVMDGDSTDGSAELPRSQALTNLRWWSETDPGQSEPGGIDAGLHACRVGMRESSPGRWGPHMPLVSAISKTRMRSFTLILVLAPGMHGLVRQEPASELAGAPLRVGESEETSERGANGR